MLGYEIQIAIPEYLRSKAQRIGPACSRRNPVLVHFELLHCLSDCCRLLLEEEESGRRIMLFTSQSLEGTAASIRDDRCSASLRLDGRDAEILFCGKYECF